MKLCPTSELGRLLIRTVKAIDNANKETMEAKVVKNVPPNLE